MSSESIYKGITGPAGPQEGRFTSAIGGETLAQRAHFLGRLENAYSRLESVADKTVGNAMTLTGGWPQQANTGKDAPANAGVLGAVEDIASAIHRVCDRIDEANRAVAERLP